MDNYKFQMNDDKTKVVILAASSTTLTLLLLSAALNFADCEVEALAWNIKEVLYLTAQDVLSCQRKNKQCWVTNIIIDLCDQKRALKKDRKSKLKQLSNTKK